MRSSRDSRRSRQYRGNERRRSSRDRRSGRYKDRGRSMRRSSNRNNRDRRRRDRDTTSYESRSRSRSRSISSSSSVDDEVGHFNAQVGDVLKDRYEIVSLMGKGTFGKVYQCRDRKHNDVVAVKVVRAIERYIDSARIEGDLLDDIYEQQAAKKQSFCVKMFSRFRLDAHYCMVFEPLGASLYDIVKKNDYKRLPLDMVRNIGRQLLQAMSFLRSVNLIHTDLKLENVLFVHSRLRDYEVTQEGRTWTISAPEKHRIKLIDFGGATYDDDAHKSRIVNTRQYRGPEVTLEIGWSFPSDIWSTGCLLAEIYSGDLLFQTHEDLEHIALMERLCGPFPLEMQDKSPQKRRFFDRHGKVRIDDLPRSSQSFVRNEAPCFEKFFSLEESDKHCGVREVVSGLLVVDPRARLTADEALEYPFFQTPSPDMSHSASCGRQDHAPSQHHPHSQQIDPAEGNDGRERERKTDAMAR